MSTTTPPQTPAGHLTAIAGAAQAIARTIKQEAASDDATMDDGPVPTKFTPLNKMTDSNDASDAEEDDDPVPEPVTKATPKKRGSNAVKTGAEGPPPKKRAPAKPKAAKESKTPKEKVVKEKAPKGSASKGDKRPIPLSFEEADEADRLLVEMKNRGAPWKEIKEMWTEKTGQVPGGSTLGGRYGRIKDNLMHLKPGEAEHLRKSVKAVEARLLTEKWCMVATEMKQRGCEPYSTAFIQKQLKIIEDQIVKGTYVAVTVPVGKAVNGDAEDDGEEDEAENEEGDEVKDEETEDAVKAEDEEED